MDIDEILDADGKKSRSDILLFSKYSTGEEDHSNNEKCDKCSGMLKTVGMHTKSCECSFIVLASNISSISIFICFVVSVCSVLFTFAHVRN
jgi:metal-responsive CopG/Arc/MetJ family transcriptional regulator